MTVLVNCPWIPNTFLESILFLERNFFIGYEEGWDHAVYHKWISRFLCCWFCHSSSGSGYATEASEERTSSYFHSRFLSSLGNLWITWFKNLYEPIKPPDWKMKLFVDRIDYLLSRVKSGSKLVFVLFQSVFVLHSGYLAEQTEENFGCLGLPLTHHETL